MSSSSIKAIASGIIGLVIRGVILIILIMGLYKAGQKAYDFGFRIFTEEPMSAEPGRDVSITIAQGDSTLDVGKMLEEKGLIRDAYLFAIQKKCSEYTGDIKPGFYTLNTSMTADDMFAIIAPNDDEDSGGDESDESDGSDSTATPLTEADPLTIETSGDWEGAEESEADVEAEGQNETDAADSQEGTQDNADAAGDN